MLMMLSKCELLSLRLPSQFMFPLPHQTVGKGLQLAGEHSGASGCLEPDISLVGDQTRAKKREYAPKWPNNQLRHI